MFLPFVIRPTAFITADFGNVIEVCFCFGELYGLMSNPADLIFAFLGNFQKGFGSIGSAYNFIIGRGRVVDGAKLDDIAGVFGGIRRNVLAFELVSATGANLFTRRDGIATFRADLKRRSFALRRIRVECPAVILIREAVAKIVLHVVDNNGDFVRVVRIRAERSQRLLNVES